VVGNHVSWGGKKLLGGICVLLDGQDVLFETESAFFTAKLQIGTKHFTEVHVLSAACGRLSRDREFLFLVMWRSGSQTFRSFRFVNTAEINGTLLPTPLLWGTDATVEP
jgi:hypothetical protein